ncbi:MAG TPA: DUF3617 family protein [Terracidiphilus sp.]|nr:DUF3617 family protein [Terracidiphilus sp.]
MMRILTGILLLFAAASTFSQTLSIKEGLWESTVLDDDGSVAMRSLDCVLQKSMAEMIIRANKHPGCTVASQNITSRSITVDISCNRPRVQASVHSLMELLDSEHGHSTTTMKMTIDGKARESTTKSRSRFIKADCGGIKPGSPEITSQ